MESKLNCAPRGFTLVELLIVVLVIGILMAMLFPALTAALCSGREARTRAQIHAMDAALTAYYRDLGTYPPDSDGADGNGGFGSASLVAALSKPGPHGNAYISARPSETLGAAPALHYMNFVYGASGEMTLDAIHYARNLGVAGGSAPAPMQAPTWAVNGGGFDLWAAGCRRKGVVPYAKLANW